MADTAYPLSYHHPASSRRVSLQACPLLLLQPGLGFNTESMSWNLRGERTSLPPPVLSKAGNASTELSTDTAGM